MDAQTETQTRERRPPVVRERKRPVYPGVVPEIDINGPEVAAVTRWIINRRGSHRPPVIAARVLVMIVELDARDLPFPDRKLLAEMLETNKDSIDAARNAAMYHQEVFEEFRHRDSENLDLTRRTWITRWRHYRPCDELIDVVRDAKRRAKQRRAA